MSDRQVLPLSVRPSAYHLELTPNAAEFSFSATVDICVNILEETDNIQVNAVDLEIDSCVLKMSEQTFTPTCSLNTDTQVLTFLFSSCLPKGTGILHIAYRGCINDKMSGFYRAAYGSSDGIVRHIFSTHFEPTGCRRALPCWDEPAAKAKFTVAINCSPSFTALSNMHEVKTTQLSNELVKHEFAETPLMSTYLLAFIIGDLRCIETIAASEPAVQIRVFALPNQMGQCKIALDAAAKIIQIFNEFFAIPYPLQKLDLVAVPEFPIGAMENFGLMTFRQSCLLADESTSLINLQHIIVVIAHEISHQWFGNIVTMEWWNDLWLKEGFATWMGFYATDKLHPEWDIWTYFLIDETEAGLKLDSQKSSHPIEVPVRNPSEVGQIFDHISYAKGASLINMLSSYLTVNVFRDGIRSYLKCHSYGNAVTTDLWKSVSETSGIDVEKLMKAWTSQTGYPVISIKQTSANTIKLTQQRYFSFQATETDAFESLWPIPLTVCCYSNGHFIVKSFLLEGKSTELCLPNCDSFKVNAAQSGFYRAMYENDSLRCELLTLIQSGVIAETRDRLGIIADSFALSFSRHLPTTFALDLIAAFTGKHDYVVWSKIADGLGEILSNWFEEHASNIDSLKKFMKDIFEDVAIKLLRDETSEEDSKLALMKQVCVGAAAKAGSQQ